VLTEPYLDLGDSFPFSALTLLVWIQKGIWRVKQSCTRGPKSFFLWETFWGPDL